MLLSYNFKHVKVAIILKTYNEDRQFHILQSNLEKQNICVNRCSLNRICLKTRGCDN